LLPQIKPRRGRRKPEDEEPGKSPSQRPSPLHDEYPPTARPDVNEPWSAHPEGRGSVFLFPPAPDPLRLNASTGQPPPSHGGSSDVAQTPLTAYPHPHSAITPITRNAFWADPSEPKSAITPSKPRSTSRRHGAKVVSSAWRSGGAAATGKTRGRPPINRGGNPDGPFSAFPTISEAQTPVFKLPSPTPDRRIPQSAVTPVSRTILPPEPLPTRLSASLPPPAPAPPAPQHQILDQPSPVQEGAPPRPAKRSRLSLQVPERVGGEVRLATPPLPLTAPPTAPPVVMVNGQEPRSQENNGPPNGNANSGHIRDAIHQQQQQERAGAAAAAAVATAPSNHPDGVESFFGQHLGASPAANTQIQFQDRTDRTNMDAVEEFFSHEILMASWFDFRGEQLPACCVDEAIGLARTVIENLRRTAGTKESFLINLSSLVGGKMLMPRGALRITRLELAHQVTDRNRYLCEWELRYGDIRGTYAMEETVLHSEWKKEKKGGPSATEEVTDGGTEAEQERWRDMYKEMLEMIQKRDEDVARLKRQMMEFMRRAR